MDRSPSADFGVRRLYELLTPGSQVGFFSGSLEALAPEQLTGGQINSYTDVYALGAVTYRLLTGQPVFNGDNFRAVAEQHLHAQPPSLARARPGIARRARPRAGERACQRPGAADPAPWRLRGRLSACRCSSQRPARAIRLRPAAMALPRHSQGQRNSRSHGVAPTAQPSPRRRRARNRAESARLPGRLTSTVSRQRQGGVSSFRVAGGSS